MTLATKLSKSLQRLIFTVGGSDSTANWMEGSPISSMEKADLVVFTGGADISPELYNAERHPTTHPSPHRDKYEVEMYKRARELNKPMIGICRGAQLLCAMAGGILVQDQDNPHSIHEMDSFDGRKIVVTSCHHQAMYPWDLPDNEYQVLGWTKGHSRYHYGETDREELVLGKGAGGSDLLELEVCHFPVINGLGIQSHPEWAYGRMDDNVHAKEYIQYCRDLLDFQLQGLL